MITDLLQMVSFEEYGFCSWASHTQSLLRNVSAAKPMRIWGMQGWTEGEAGLWYSSYGSSVNLTGAEELRSWDGCLLFHFGLRGLPFSSFPISTDGWMWAAHGRRMEPRERLSPLKGNSKVPQGQQPSLPGAGRWVSLSLGHPEQPTTATTAEGVRQDHPLPLFSIKDLRELSFWVSKACLSSTLTFSLYNFPWCSHFTHWQTSGQIKIKKMYLLVFKIAQRRILSSWGNVPLPMFQRDNVYV